MELFDNLALGVSTALSASTLIACAIGVTLGTFIGVLPGVGPIAGVALLLPLTFGLDPTDALVMLAGIYYGGMYGGSTAAILLNLPGTPATAVSALEGYPLSKAGRAGVALGMTTIASFLGGSFSILIMMLFSVPLANVAMAFGSAEYFSMMLLGLVAAAALVSGSPLKGLTMVAVGLVLGLIGSDVQTGQFRFTFGQIELVDGLSLVVVAMGLFGVSEIFFNFSQSLLGRPIINSSDITWRSLLPTRDEVSRSWLPMGRGSALGAVMGFLPGAGATIAAFMTYGMERRLSKEPERFGKGAVEVLGSVEAANNSSAQAAFIPTMTLGIPGNAVMALMLGALMIHGITPGPLVVTNEPELFWGLVISFWIGNFMLLVLNLPMIWIWVRMLTIPYHILYPAILFFICIGVFSVNNSTFNVFLVLAFGVVGFGMKVLDYPIAPLLLGFVLGPLMEEHFRRAMQFSRGDLTVFVTQPISGAFVLSTMFLLVISVRAALRTAKN